MLHQPNILYLHSHDTGRYISPYGHALQTPHLQAFAERGVTFRNAFCANPTCSPSRACLLTGRYAHANGMMGLAHRGGRISRPDWALPHTLQTHGYDTALAGLQHIARLGPESDDAMTNYGYTHELFKQRNTGGDFNDLDQSTVEVAVDFLQSRSTQDAPFFLDAGFFATHRTPTAGTDIQWHNGEASPLGDPRFVVPPPCLPDAPAVRADFADYAESVRRLDHYYGQILAALDKADLTDDTLVVITTDHGLAFPWMKCNLTAHGTGVLLLMAGPGAAGGHRFTGGRVFDGLVSHLDIYPTLCAVAGVDRPEWLQGESVLPMLDDHAATIRDEVFAEVNYHAAFEPKRAVRTREFSYIRQLHPEPRRVLANIDDSVTKRELYEAGVFDTPPASEVLYDLRADPGETRNVIDGPDYSKIASQLRKRLDDWMARTDDPALRDALRVSGMLANPRDGYTPSFQEAISED